MPINGFELNPLERIKRVIEAHPNTFTEKEIAEVQQAFNYLITTFKSQAKAIRNLQSQVDTLQRKELKKVHKTKLI